MRVLPQVAVLRDIPLLQIPQRIQRQRNPCLQLRRFCSSLTELPILIQSRNTGPLVTPTCAGTTYTIDPADDCNTIARSQGIGTGWLLIDNDLPLYCHEFPSSGELCLINKCSTTTVPGNSTCEMIADSHNITEAQLKSWNPVSIMRLFKLVRGKKLIHTLGTGRRLPQLAPDEWA